MRPSMRIKPQLPAEAMKTYQVLAPKTTHFAPCPCSAAGCAHYLNGWKTAIDESTDLGKQQAYYIRNQSGRSYTEDRNIAPGLTVFVFEAGQNCFKDHERRLDKPEIYLVKGGDWRGNPRGEKRQHNSAADWVDDFSEHQDKIITQLNQG